ncbi:hypothetical protein BH23GEM6_BH23GEM6_15100 [soil metagenome]
MRLFRQPEPDYAKEGITLALGALGGLAAGLLLSRRTARQPVVGLGTELREKARQAGERARSAVERLEPGRLRRMAGDQTLLTELEDAVLDSFFADAMLSERGIDVGAISHGIIELSGSVWSDDEADRAVRLANAIPGVRTVVNRLSIEQEAQARESRLRAVREEGGNVTSIQREVARTGGMGTRRQSRLTDPDRPDDSQHREHRSLHRADRDQWIDEGFAAVTPHMSQRSEVKPSPSTEYSEDEMDNQDPHGNHAHLTLDSQPQASNPRARMGEGTKPGVDLALEKSGLSRETENGDRSNDS